METIQLGGRAVVGFGVGDAAPMTVQEAAKVSQGWGLPAFKGAAITFLGTYLGGVIGNLSAGDRYRDRPEVVAGLTALGLLGGAVVSGGIAGVVTARYGRRQDQAAAVLAQAQAATQPSSGT